MLRRWPAILAALAAGALLLGATAAAPALFLASTGTDALERAVAESTRYGAGVTIAFRELRRGVLPGADDPVPTAPVRDEVLEAAAGLPYLDDDRILSMLGDPVEVTTQRPGAGPANPVRVVHRTGALDHIRVLEGSPTGQIRPFARPTRGQTPTHPAWIQDVTAEALEVGPGDLVTLGSGETKAVVEVAGIYEALANAPPRAYWEPLAEEFRPPSVDAPLPPPFVLVERAAFDDVTDELRQREAEFQWEFPLEVDATLDVTSATDLVADFTRLNGRLLDVRSPLGRYFEARCRSCPGRLPIRMDFRSTLEQDVVEARDTVAGLRPSIELLAVVGLVSAIVVVGAAGAYSVNRRRTEVRYLIARGMAPATVGWKSAVESFLPATAGTAAGFALVAIALARFGPGATLDPAGVAEAARVTAVVLPVALVVIGVVAAAASIPPSERRSFARLTWEIPVLALAAFALREIVRRGGVVTESASGVERPSAWLLVFPVLLVAGVAGLAARGFRRTLVMMRRRDRGASMPVYLAMNRLAAARALALMLITASALAFGMFLYAQTMAASVEATTVAKSHVFTGSDVSVPVDRSYVVPESFPWPSTLTSTKLDAGRVQPGNTTVDVLAIDVETFEDAAYWDDSFSDRPLGALVDELRDPPPSVLPVIVAGELPDGAVLEMGGVEIPHDVVARVDAWPGRFLDRTLVVINRATSGPVIEQAGGLDPVTA
ncbi:MAG TPA: FtsX-like permease family protein, partial [Actinomycetota bacterium]